MRPIVARAPVLRVCAGAAIAALGAAWLAVAQAAPQWSLAAGSEPASALGLAAGWSIGAAGLLLWTVRPASAAGPLFTLAAAAWFLAAWSNPGVGSAFVFTVGLVLGWACPPLVGHAALAYPAERLGRRRPAVALAYAGALAGLGLLPAVFFAPARQGCGDCPANLVALSSDAGAVAALGRWGLVAAVCWAGLLVALIALRLARASAAPRRTLAPVLLPCAGYLVLAAAQFAHGAHRGFTSNDVADRRLWLAQAVALLAAAGGVGWGRIHARRTRAAVARLTVDLSTAPAPGRLRAVLAELIGDPSLAVAYARRDESWLDADGRAVTLPGDGVTRLMAGDRAVAALIHRPGALDDPVLADEIATTARLALEHERLRAELRAELKRLRASRARIVATGDLERRRLERDLHDGAQQGLVTLALALRLQALRAGDPRTAAGYEAAEAEVRAALAELRELAHRLRPAALEEDGIAGAVDALAERSSRLVPGDVTPERFPAAVESTVHYVIAESVRRSGATVAVDVRRAGGELVVDVAVAEPLPLDLVDVEDRVGALGGRLAVERDGARSRLRAQVPCG